MSDTTDRRTPEQKAKQELIVTAVCNALDWDGGILTYAEEAVREAGYEWTDADERFALSVAEGT
jgi:hypothetical protein